MIKIKLLLLILLLNSTNLFAASFRKINIESPLLKKQIKVLVEMSKDLHELVYTIKKEETKALLIKLEKHVEKTKAIVAKDSQQADYLISLFEQMQKSFKKAQDLEKQERRDILKIGFEKVVRVTQGFDVGNYRTFYCQQHKDLWIQRSWVVKNPVHPKSRCGVLVN
jgi:predicted RNA-binding protein with EMAP domain